MPLTPEFTWTETAAHLELKIPLKGTSARKVDVFVTDCVLKVAFPPYLADLDLHGRIDDDNSKAFVRNGVLVIKAKKHESSARLWGELCAPKGPETLSRREQSIADKAKRDQELQERAKARKHEDERKALREQMSVEQAERQHIDDLKAEEKRRAEEDVYRTLAQLESKRGSGKPASAAATSASPLTTDQQPQVPPAEAQCAGDDDTGASKVAPTDAEAALHGKHSPSGSSSSDSSSSCGGSEKSSGSSVREPASADAIWTAKEALASEDDDAGSASDVESQESDGGDCGGSYVAAEVGSSGSKAIRGDEESTGSAASSGDGSWVNVRRLGNSAEDPKSSSTYPENRLTKAGESSLAQAKVKSEDVKVDEDVRYTPAPRSSRQVAVGFTPRVFPTPLRESKAAEEEAWVIRNRPHLRRNKNAALGGLKVEECDPAWLKAKADDFYRSGDLLSAASAYTSALDAAAELLGDQGNEPAGGGGGGSSGSSSGGKSKADADAAAAATVNACLSNRAACYLRLSRYDKCVEDCSAALEAHGYARDGSSVSVAAAPPAVAKLLARRGAALAKLADYESSAKDLRKALALAPQDAALAADAEAADSLARCAELKKKADQAVAMAGSGDGGGSGGGGGGAGGLQAALELYTEALALVPTFVSCISNRAACHLAMGNARLCEEDCSAALRLLSAEKKGPGPESALPHGATTTLDNPAVNAPVGPLPAPGTEKRKQWVLRTLARRGAARVRLESYETALSDFLAAAELAPEDDALRADVERLRGLVMSGRSEGSDGVKKALGALEGSCGAAATVGATEARQ